MLKISTKMSLIYLSFTALIIILMAASMYYIYYYQRLQSIDADLQDYAAFLTTNIELDDLELSKIYGKVKQKKEKINLKLNNDHMFVLTNNDSIFYESNDSVILDSILIEIMNSTLLPEHLKFRTIDINHQSYRTYAVDIGSKYQTKIQIIMISSLERFYESLNTLSYILFVISPTFLLIAALIGYFISKRSFEPVRQLTNAAKLISAENLNSRVPVRNANDDLTYLATTFNEMIERLDKTFKSQKQFIADASHDFRTPLTIIKLELEILLSRKDLNDDVRIALQKSLNEVKSLSNLADNLLFLARADSNQLKLNKEKFRIDELLLSSLSNFNVIISEKGLSFRIDINNDYELFADKDMIKRVLYNLVDNAIKYSIKDSIIEIQLYEENSSLSILIKNKYEKTSLNSVDAVFDRFSRSSNTNQIEGFGLGLPIVKTIIEHHKGIIQNLSDENFFIILIKF